MFNGYIPVVLWWITNNYVWCTRLDVKLDHDNSGYFIKPLFQGAEFFTLNKEEKPFIITQNSRAGAFETDYGLFHVREEINDNLLRNTIVNHSTFGNGVVFGDVEISAHLVSRTVTLERPILQVLFHASQYKSSQHHSNVDSNNNKGYYNSPNLSASRFCMQVEIERRKRNLTALCVLGENRNVCLTEIDIPEEWWITDTSYRSVNIDVYYSVYKLNPKDKQCVYKNILPSSLNPDGCLYSRSKRLISSVSLTHGQLSYQELKENQHLLVYVPQKSFYPGSKFRVPVKLQIRSDLQEFEIKVRAKHGISLFKAEPSDRTQSEWQITEDFKPGDRKGSVKAKRNKSAIFFRDRIQDIFDWIFQVDNIGHADRDSDHDYRHPSDEYRRIILILEYVNSGGLKTGGTYPEVSKKVVAKVQIQYDNVYSIVPVIKTKEVINTAIITGHRQNFSMQIYSISRDGQIEDITKQTTCHSGDETVLKVAQTCNQVYLDGSEANGSPSVSVIAKYGRHSKFLFFRVWVPEFPLEIELSDPKLSQIKSWRLPLEQKSPTGRGPRFKVGGGMMSQHGMIADEPEDDNDGSCSLKYQQSIIEVYVKFYIPDGEKHLYLVHRKASFRVTDIVSRNLRAADESVAKVIGNVVHGVKSGRTEIQVMSHVKNRAIGAKEIRVGNDKISIKELTVKVVSDITVEIVAEKEMPGALAARIVTNSYLMRHFQEAFLDITIDFYDGTSMPLHLVPENEYDLYIETKNKSIVELGPSLSEDTPKIIYAGPGKGDLLHVNLEIGNKCQRKKTRPLASTYVYVECKPEQPYKKIMAAAPITPGRDGSTNANESNKKNVDTKYLVNVGSSFEGSTKSGPKIEAQSQKILSSRKMSHLEIGMYVLLGVFIIAILVFVVNCVIFMNRHQKKRGGLSSVMGLTITAKRDAVSNANDWVWIGRDTLERNAINTGCNQALMSEQDFTVNKNVARFLLPQSNPSSNRSSCATGNGGSNRNSVISTYKGSECSIRITPNPISNETNVAEYATVPRQRHQLQQHQHQSHCGGSNGMQNLCRPPLHTFHGPSSRSSPHKGGGGGQSRCSYHNGYPALSDIQSTSAMSSSDERGSCSSLPSRWSSLKGGPGTPGSVATYGSTHSHSRVPTPQQQARFAQVAAEMAQRAPLVEQKDLLAQAAAQIAEHEEDVANGNLTDSSVEWDYEAMGMTYEQLMEYFDNLKESTA